MTQEYPKKMYKLTPSLVPKEITVEPYSGWTNMKYYRILENDSLINPSKTYPTIEEAFEAAHSALNAQEADIKKRTERLNKRFDAVRKAESKHRGTKP